MSSLSNFEKGFADYIIAMEMTPNRSRTRKINESICLMASEDYTLMKKIVVNTWMINRALSSPFADRYLN